MYSIHYFFAKTKGLRRLLQILNRIRLSPHIRRENKKKKNDPKNLMNFEKKIFSQNGEDGIIQEIFERIGLTNRFFIEIGIENGTECNTRNLLESKSGWRGVWLEGSSEHVKSAKKQFSKFNIKVKCSFVSKDNICESFEELEVPKEPDLLSIDIDGNDYWIWKKLKDYKPRVVIMEYNSSHLPGTHWVMPYDENHIFDGTNHFGASLEAYYDLATRMGYRLVGCDSRGINAFFIRNDLDCDKFTNTLAGPKYHYNAPKFHSQFFGFPSGKGPWMKY